MIARMRSTMSENEAGQSLVLGAVSLLILALAVMVTVQLGWTIDQRIKVQNAADNAAYSAAAVVARSLNFIAFVNRTSVSHYVAMMAFQSISSYLTGVQTLLWMLADLIESLAAIFCYVQSAAAYCDKVPIYGVICLAIETVFMALSKICYYAAKALYELLSNTWSLLNQVDKLMALAVKAVGVLNNTVMFNVARAIKTLTGTVLDANLLGNFQEKIIRETAGPNTNDDGFVATSYKAAMGWLNGNVAGSYNSLFDEDSHKIPKGGTEADGKSSDDSNMVQNAERLMVEISNASRTGKGIYNQDMTFESDRGFGGENSVAKFLGWIYVGSTRLVKHMDTQTFTEGTGKSAGPGNAVAKAEQAGQACKTAQDHCKPFADAAKVADDNCATAKTNCSNAQNQCTSDPSCAQNPSCSSCTNAKSTCDAKDTTCADAKAKDDKREDECADAKKKCQSQQDSGDSTKAEIDSEGGAEKSEDKDNADPNKRNYIFENKHETSDWSRGGALASAEYVKATAMAAISGGSGRMVGIQSFYKTDDDKAFHCRLANDSNSNEDGYKGDDRHYWVKVTINPQVGECPAYAYTKETKCYGKDDDNEHKWYGIAPYYSFNPQPDKKDNLFNQPDFWALVNKSPKEARFPPELALGFTSGSEFKWTNYTHMQGITDAGRTANLDGVGRINDGKALPGLNGWARAMCYYHRPGAWAEPPNLFNPFWKAKLSPLGGSNKLAQKLTNHTDMVTH